MQAYDHLVKRAQSADRAEREEAFNQLIIRFQDAAQSWAYRMLNDENLAQDAAQEAFIAAYEKIDQLQDPAAFPAWLKRIVVTQCSREGRRKGFRVTLSSPFEDDEPVAHDDPADAVEERDLQEQVSRAVRALPEHERVVTELFYITGYSQQEIAEQLALPLTTVKKRLQYAREHLRETIPPISSLHGVYGMAPHTGFSYMPYTGIPDVADPYEGGGIDFAPNAASLLTLLAWLYPELLVTA